MVYTRAILRSLNMAQDAPQQHRAPPSQHNWKEIVFIKPHIKLGGNIKLVLFDHSQVCKESPVRSGMRCQGLVEPVKVDQEMQF